MMRNKILTLLGTGLLLAACESGSTCGEQNVTVGAAPTPGSAEDFKANVKDRVFFAFDKHNITPESQASLEAQAGWLKTYPNTHATVEGHCDERGTREYNLALGERRANAAAQGLQKAGVDAGRLKVISFGKDKPIVAGSNEEAWAQNRVAITVIE
jgi:peptidoglycan-associated lipoprotein